MRIAARLAAAAALTLGGLGLAAPSQATTSLHLTLSAGPFAPDASVSMIGTGCAAHSHISLDVWNTASSTSHVQANDIVTDTGTGGSFGHVYDLNNQFPPGAEVGFAFSCTAAFDWSVANDPLADHSYAQTTDPDPQVSIDAPSGSVYGNAVQVVAHTEAVFGNVTLTLDGVPRDADPSSVYGTYVYRLPAHLTVGSHALHATWTPQAAGSPTVTADKTLRVTKIHPALGLRLSRSTIRRGGSAAARVTLSHTGAAPRAGVVVLKKNGHEVARGRIRTADNGVRIFVVSIRAVGTYHLTAVFLGSRTLTRATSPTRTLTVHR
jgi:hypothetical protein